MNTEGVRTVLICDDQGPIKEGEGPLSLFLTDLSEDLKAAGFQIVWFNGRDSEGYAITDKGKFLKALQQKFDGRLFDLLVMDLAWWPKGGLTAEFIGLDFLEGMVPLLFLPQNVVVISQFRIDDIAPRINAIKIPLSNVIPKYTPRDSSWSNLLSRLRDG